VSFSVANTELANEKNAVLLRVDNETTFIIKWGESEDLGLVQITKAQLENSDKSTSVRTRTYGIFNRCIT
jgi:hypothetical protein